MSFVSIPSCLMSLFSMPETIDLDEKKFHMGRKYFRIANFSCEIDQSDCLNR